MAGETIITYPGRPGEAMIDPRVDLTVRGNTVLGKATLRVRPGHPPRLKVRDLFGNRKLAPGATVRFLKGPAAAGGTKVIVRRTTEYRLPSYLNP